MKENKKVCWICRRTFDDLKVRGYNCEDDAFPFKKFSNELDVCDVCYWLMDEISHVQVSTNLWFDSALEDSLPEPGSLPADDVSMEVYLKEFIEDIVKQMFSDLKGGRKNANIRKTSGMPC